MVLKVGIIIKITLTVARVLRKIVINGINYKDLKYKVSCHFKPAILKVRHILGKVKLIFNHSFSNITFDPITNKSSDFKTNITLDQKKYSISRCFSILPLLGNKLFFTVNSHFF